jgi:hypothetical protein
MVVLFVDPPEISLLGLLGSIIMNFSAPPLYGILASCYEESVATTSARDDKAHLGNVLSGIG